MRKWLWRSLGLLFVGCAYIGAIVPGIPMTTFAVLALWCFAKSSPELHDWLYNHPKFGPYLQDWKNKRIYPTRVKFIMLGCCAASYAWLIYISMKPIALVSIGLFMLFWLIWAWRYPGSHEEYDRRVAAGKRIGWLK